MEAGMRQVSQPSRARCTNLTPFERAIRNMARCLVAEAFRDCMVEGRAYWSIKRQRPNVWHLKGRTDREANRLI